MIDRETIDRIFSTADIVEVVGDFVKLKRSGSNYKGMSPFTNEKTASFFVSPAKGIYKCFSSGKGGNAVSFIMEHEKLSYPEALKYLARKYNIEFHEKEVTADEIRERNERESLLTAVEFAGKQFTEWLWERQEGKAIGMGYFKERGFREEIIKRFQLGYSLEQRDAFTKVAVEKGYKLEYLVKTGLTVDKNNFQFDRFAGRVIFPIHGLSGQVIGFGGRILKKDDKMAKYLNSPESDIYHKSHTLYGIYFAKQHIIKEDKCFLVEGYTDVISMHQAGIENVVASSGTALTKEQIRLIKRFTKNVTVLYDGDAAGIKASLRGIDLILEEGLNVKVMLLPDGEDPDSYARQHSSTEIRKFIDEGESDFIRFKTKLLLKDAENDPIKRATLITDIVRSIAVIPESITRTVYLKDCSKLLDIEERVLHAEVLKIRQSKYNEKTPSYAQKTREEKIQQPVAEQKKEDSQLHELELIQAIIKHGNVVIPISEDENATIAKYIIHELEEDFGFQNPVYQKIMAIVRDKVAHGETIDDKDFLQNEDPEISHTAVNLVTSPYELSVMWKQKEILVETEEMKLKQKIPSIVLAFKRTKVLSMLTEVQKSMSEAVAKNDVEEISLLQQKFMVLSELKKNIASELGKRVIL